MVSKKSIIERMDSLLKDIDKFELKDKVELINKIRLSVKKISPFQNEPVDVVQWIPIENVVANEYNPNKVAPPEMKLLELSIREDGYTQPIVAFKEDNNVYTVIDGFHRNRVGKETEDINKRIHGYLPLVIVDKPLKDRMASTIRHNRARGTHGIAPMSKLVEELYFMGWSDKKISEQLGMDKDEVLRLKQFTGLGVLFKGKTYSKSWV